MRRIELLPDAEVFGVGCPECGALLGEDCSTMRSPFPRPCAPHAARIKLANDRRGSDV
jgi:hypothetical protein